ncbi:serine protease family S33 [Thraustotheca clavata]|uniref:Serine protease family S33 n=1 Tax=Thraustotheca clavata TaxID=74557 RepID=A0A1V9ZP80_9STRA|nr:serine protease family S33 [Thraustotheca clavata]
MKITQKSLSFANKQLLHYTQWGPPTAASTVVLLHGAPGSHLDFEDLAPLLVSPTQNVIAFDLPGNGRTSADLVGGLSHVSTKSVNDTVINALPQLSMNNFVLVGHSVGGRTTIEVAANPLIPSQIRGIALLNPMGLRDIRGQNLRHQNFIAIFMRFFTRNGTIPSFLNLYTRQVYVKQLGFSDTIPTIDFLGAFYRMTSANLKRIKQAAQMLRNKQVPVFLGVAKTDRFVDHKIGLELGSVLNAQTVKVYERGGHNIPKSQAEAVAKDLKLWIEQVGLDDAPLTIVMLHGCPGSHLDYQYLAPLVVNEDSKVVSFDLPGNGTTSAKVVGGLPKLTAESIVKVVISALRQLSFKKFILLGHSLGGHTTLQVAAESSLAPNLLGISLLNPMGLRPPRWQYPMIQCTFASLMRYYTTNDDDSNVLTRWNRSFYVNNLRFPSTIPESHFTAACFRITSTNYHQIAIDVEILRQRKVPVFMALSSNDRVVEPDIGHELAAALNADTIKVWDKGGHNIPKSQAANIAQELQIWYQAL